MTTIPQRHSQTDGRTDNLPRQYRALRSIAKLKQEKEEQQQQQKELEVLRQHRPPPNVSSSRIRIVIRNGLPDPDSDANRHQNVISWSLVQNPALRKISSKSVGNSTMQ